MEVYNSTQKFQRSPVTFETNYSIMMAWYAAPDDRRKQRP